MGQSSKITQYQLEARVLALRVSGASHEEIAARVTGELRSEKGIEDNYCHGLGNQVAEKGERGPGPSFE